MNLGPTYTLLIDGGISRLDLLPSSIDFMDIQEKLSFVAMHGNFETNPQDILRRALAPVIDRYVYVIIDCPPSLGIVTKNGLRFSTHYCIPTIPDVVSTWGVFQIVSNIAEYAESLNRSIKPIGIIGTKVQGNMELYICVFADLWAGRLFDGKDTELEQPPLFKSVVMQTVAVARGADAEADLRTFRQKYGNNYESLSSPAATCLGTGRREDHHGEQKTVLPTMARVHPGPRGKPKSGPADSKAPVRPGPTSTATKVHFGPKVPPSPAEAGPQWQQASWPTPSLLPSTGVLASHSEFSGLWKLVASPSQAGKINRRSYLQLLPERPGGRVRAGEVVTRASGQMSPWTEKC